MRLVGPRRALRDVLGREQHEHDADRHVHQGRSRARTTPRRYAATIDRRSADRQDAGEHAQRPVLGPCRVSETIPVADGMKRAPAERLQRRQRTSW